MLQFQESDLYRAALELSLLVDEVSNNAVEAPPPSALDTLQRESNAILVELARTERGDAAERRLFMRESAQVCLAMIDVCHGAGFLLIDQYERVIAAAERVVELGRGG